jgi:hypothetical protein
MTAEPGHARWCQLGEHPPGVPCSEIVPDPRYAALAAAGDGPPVVTEYATLMSGGGWHVRWADPETFAPAAELAAWIAAKRRTGSTVGRRRLVVVEDWTEVEKP